MNDEPRRLDGCDVLPPLEIDDDHRTSKATRPKQSSRRRKAAGRFATLNTFVDFTAGTLRRSEIVVWLILYRDTKDGIARTSQADIARRGGLGRRTVCLAIRRLERRGLLCVVYRGGLNRGASSYRVQALGDNEQQAQRVAR